MFMFQCTTPTHLEGKYRTKLSGTPAALAILRQRAPDGTAHRYYDSWQCQSNSLPPSTRVLGRGRGRKTCRSNYWMERQWRLHTDTAALALNINSFKEFFSPKFYIRNSLLLVLAFGFLLFSINQLTLQIIWEDEVCPNLVMCECSMVTAVLKHLSLTAKPKFSLSI